MPDALIYTRFSPRPNADECDSIEKQSAQLEALADRLKLTVRESFHDAAVSGAKEERDGLYNMLRSIRKGDTILIRDPERMARDTSIAIWIRHTIKSKGAKIHFAVHGEALETPTGRFISGIFDLQAQLDRELRNERTSSAMRRHQKNGRRMSAQPPYGWKPDPRNPQLLVEAKGEQAIILKIVDLYDTIRTYNGVAIELNDQGITTRNGKQWTNKQITRILRRYYQDHEGGPL